jgi:hypothetical protein
MTLIVEPDFQEKDKPSGDGNRNQLASWVEAQVQQWRTARDSTFRERWDSYYRIWRGRWDADSRTRRSERSRIISPASQIAVDLAVSEMIEAIFSREQIFDISDDISDAQRDDAIRARDLLTEDLYADGIVESLTEICTLGALYGQFIAKIVHDVEEVGLPQVIETKDEETGAITRAVRKVITEKVRVYPVAVEPGQLAVDPSAISIDGGLGAAHEFLMPLHAVRTRQANGVYYSDVVVGEFQESLSTDDRGEDYNPKSETSAAHITEYHGLVPKKLLTLVRAGDDDELVDSIVQGEDNDAMVEAIVTIANGSILLRAIPNPSVMEDRALISAQFDTVPNRFWGRSVMEKGWNMQKALDAELRSRSDALAWINNPMLAGDITKLPPNMDLNSWPGKFWGTKGDPREALTELRFGEINPSTFQQAQDLERMIQQATGQVDPSVLNQGVRDQATGASAINVSGIVKRNKRTMLNMELFLTTLIRRIAWRKMQFEPEKYPQDFEFQVRGTVGIMAREVEQQQNIQMLQFVDKGTPEYFGVLQLVVEGSSGSNKAGLNKILQQAMQPPSEEEQQKAQQLEQLQLQAAVADLENTKADTALKNAQAGKSGADAHKSAIEAEMIDDELQLGTVKATVDIKQAQNQERQIATGERKQALEEAKFNRGE